MIQFTGCITMKSDSNLAIGGLKAKSEIDLRIIYASLFIIVGLALFSHLSANRTSSITSAFVIVIVALGNIAYLYNKYKKRERALAKA